MKLFFLGYRNNLVGSFASSYSESYSPSKTGIVSKRIRFQKSRSDDNIPTLSVKRRSRYSRIASAPKKNSRSQRISFSPAANGAKKKEVSKSSNFANGTKGGILKKRMKDAENIKQAFIISKKVLESQSHQFKEFTLPEKWIKESQKKKKVKKIKSGGGESTSSASVEDLAMERLVRAFKTAKLLYPQKFAEYFPDFVNCLGPDVNNEKRTNINDVISKQTQLKTIKSEEDIILDKNIPSDSGDEVPKRIRKMPKILREHSASIEIARKKLDSLKEQIPSVTQKIARIRSPSTGTSGIRKRFKTSTDSPSNQSILFKSQQNGKVENIKEVADSEAVDKVPTLKRRRRVKSSFRPSSTLKATDVNSTVIQNNIEDSATESSSDESNNMRSSKRQRAQSGFYK